MERMYNNSGGEWSWNDGKKLKELQDSRMRFLVMFRHYRPFHHQPKLKVNKSMFPCKRHLPRTLKRKHKVSKITVLSCAFAENNASQHLASNYGFNINRSRMSNKRPRNWEQPVNRKKTKDVDVDKPRGKHSVVVGFAAFALYSETRLVLDHHVYLHELQVRRGFRSQGIGKFLLRKLQRIAVHKDNFDKTNLCLRPKLIMLTVLKNNVNAIEFYLGNGFQVDETSPTLCFNVNKDIYHEILSKALQESVTRYTCQESCPAVVRSRALASSAPSRYLLETVTLNSLDSDCSTTSLGEQNGRELRICNKKFRFQDSLTRHMCMEHGYSFPVDCPVPSCTRGLVCDSEVRKHLQHQHDIGSYERFLSQLPRLSRKDASRSLGEVFSRTVDVDEAQLLLYSCMEKLIIYLEGRESFRLSLARYSLPQVLLEAEDENKVVEVLSDLVSQVCYEAQYKPVLQLQISTRKKTTRRKKNPRRRGHGLSIIRTRSQLMPTNKSCQYLAIRRQVTISKHDFGFVEKCMNYLLSSVVLKACRFGSKETFSPLIHSTSSRTRPYRDKNCRRRIYKQNLLKRLVIDDNIHRDRNVVMKAGERSRGTAVSEEIVLEKAGSSRSRRTRSSQHKPPEVAVQKIMMSMVEEVRRKALRSRRKERSKQRRVYKPEPEVFVDPVKEEAKQRRLQFVQKSCVDVLLNSPGSIFTQPGRFSLTLAQMKVAENDSSNIGELPPQVDLLLGKPIDFSKIVGGVITPQLFLDIQKDSKHRYCWSKNRKKQRRGDRNAFNHKFTTNKNRISLCTKVVNRMIELLVNNPKVVYIPRECCLDDYIREQFAKESAKNLKTPPQATKRSKESATRASSRRSTTSSTRRAPRSRKRQHARPRAIKQENSTTAEGEVPIIPDEQDDADALKREVSKYNQPEEQGDVSDFAYALKLQGEINSNSTRSTRIVKQVKKIYDPDHLFGHTESSSRIFVKHHA